jgi:hypothetical protein
LKERYALRFIAINHILYLHLPLYHIPFNWIQRNQHKSQRDIIFATTADSRTLSLRCTFSPDRLLLLFKNSKSSRNCGQSYETKATPYHSPCSTKPRLMRLSRVLTSHDLIMRCVSVDFPCHH